MKRRSTVLLILIIVSLTGTNLFSQEVFSNGVDVAGTYVFGNGLITNAQDDAGVSDIAPSIGQLYGIDPDTGTNLSNEALLTVKPKKRNLETTANRQFVISADQITGDGSVTVDYSGSNVVLGLSETNVQVQGDLVVSSNLEADVVKVTDINIGADNIISGNAISSGAFVQGNGCEAKESSAHAEGVGSVAGGYSGSHAEGYHTEVWGYKGGHAEGYRTDADGDYGAHSEGDHSQATGDSGAHAEGSYTVASGDYGAHSEGLNTTASGNASHAEGDDTEASGSTSHAEGYNTVAAGYASFAGGSEAKATNDHTFVWSDGTSISSTDSQQFTIHAENGIRLLGGPTEISEILPTGDISMGVYTNHP